jgi:hypothetical protein
MPLNPRTALPTAPPAHRTGLPRALFASGCALLVAGCSKPSIQAEPGVQAPSSQPVQANEKTRPDGKPGSAPRHAPAPVADLPADGQGATAEQLNEGCKLRKNSGRVETCQKATGNLGSWTPTKQEMQQIVQLAKGACYCAADLDTPVQACVRMQATSTVSVKVGLMGEPTDCTLNIRAAEWKGRRFVHVEAVNRDMATFYTTNQVVEQIDKGFRPYFSGFNGVPGDTDIAAGGEGVSPEMKRDWPTLAPELKAFFAGP